MIQILNWTFDMLDKCAKSAKKVYTVRKIADHRYLNRTVCLLLLIMVACVSPHRDGPKSGSQVTMKLKQVSGDRRLSVSVEGCTRSWDTDTLAILTWYDAQGKEQSQAVSGTGGWKIKQQTAEKGYILECSQPRVGLTFQIRLKTEGTILFADIPSSGIQETGESRMKSIRLLPGFGAAGEGEDGYLVIAKETGALCYYHQKEPKEYKLPVYSFNGITMPLFGIVRGGGAFAGIITGGQYDAQFCIHTNWGEKHQYSMDPEFILRSFKEEKILSDDMTIEYHFLTKDESTWTGIGRCYRQYNFEHRGIRPLKQRIEYSPELAYGSQAMEIRLRLGVKPVPYEVTEQTPETEPPVRVFLTFGQVRDIFDEFRRQGIAEAEFCMVGWNIGGHDGRYPQLFPVEPSLGGEKELRKTIRYGQSLGYQVVAHNCYYDAYRIANNWAESFLRKKPDGELHKGGQWGGGQSYLQCLNRSYELFAKDDLPRIRELGFKGIHYTDVLSINGPLPCYDTDHPQTRRQDVDARNKILDLCIKTFGGVQSEGPLDFAAPVLDRFIYTSIHNGNSSQLDLPYIDENVPLHPTVYHGVMTYNMDNRTFNALPGEKEYLENIEYGGIPMAYFYGHFYMPGSGRQNWIGNRDYRYDSPEGLKKAVAGLKQVYDDFQKLKHLQMEFIEGHAQLAPGIFETVYSNGERVLVNYTDVPFRIATGEEVPAKGFNLIE